MPDYKNSKFFFKIICTGVLTSLCSFPVTALTNNTIPLQTRNQNPLIAIHGLPLATAAELLEPGEWHSGLSLNISNTLNINTDSNELLLIDGEAYRLNLIFDYGLNERWALRGFIPYISYSGGFLDKPIEDYHDLFNFDQGNRLQNPRDRLLFFYQRNGMEQLRFDSRRAGIGDMQIMAGYRPGLFDNADYSLWAGLKLPTGNENKLTGSGAADIAFWAAGRHRLSNKWQLYGTAGFLLLGNGDVLAELQEDRAGFGSFGAQWQAWKTITLKTQFEWHTSFYKNTGALFLSDVLQLSFGGSWSLSEKTVLDFAVAEDIKRDASPDVNFNITLRFKH